MNDVEIKYKERYRKWFHESRWCLEKPEASDHEIGRIYWNYNEFLSIPSVDIKNTIDYRNGFYDGWFARNMLKKGSK